MPLFITAALLAGGSLAYSRTAAARMSGGLSPTPAEDDGPPVRRVPGVMIGGVATVLTGVFALVVGVVLLAVGRALGQARGWALSPAVLAQLFALVVASGLVQGGVYVIAVPLLLVAGTVLASLLAPASRATFRGAA